MTHEGFDQAKADAEAQELFEIGFQTLKQMQVHETLSAISEVIPHSSVEEFVDFSKVGRGFPPSIHLNGKEELEISGEGAPREIIRSKRNILIVHGSIVVPEALNVVVITAWDEVRNNIGNPSSSMIWDSGKEHTSKATLGSAIDHGLMSFPNIYGRTRMRIQDILGT